MGTESYAGIDWGTRRHAVCLLDADGNVLSRSSYPHSEAGVLALIAKLQETKTRRAAVERPDGVLVDRLLDSGLAILPIPPAAAKASRRRFTATGRKSDYFDAFCLAELARTDAHRFHQLQADSDATRTLRALTRAREAMLNDKISATRQLRIQLESFWVGPTRAFRDLASPITLAFLRAYPSPADAYELDAKGMAACLGRYATRFRCPPAGLLELLRAAPSSVVGVAETEGRRATVLGLVGLLEAIVDAIRDVESRIFEATHAHPDGAIFLPLFKKRSVVIPAQLIAGLGDDRSRYPSAEALAAKAGVSPVTRQSGTVCTAVFRHGCDRRMRKTIAVLADSTQRTDPWAKAIYRAARERRHSHPHALRVLGRAWVRVLWRCWQDGVPYDPAKHGAKLGLVEAGRRRSLA